MNRAINNYHKLIIGGTVAATTASDVASMNVGEVGLFAIDGTRITGANASSYTAGRFILNPTSGSDPMVSPIITREDIVYFSDSAYRAVQYQKSVFGYSSTDSTGSIDVINNNTYFVNLELLELLTSSSDGLRRFPTSYRSGATNTQASIAEGLAKAIYDNTAGYHDIFMYVGRETNATLEAAVTNATAVVTKNQTRVTLGATLTGLVANDYISLDGLAFRVVSVSGTTVTLDVPWPRETATLANTVVRRIQATNGNSADWGVVAQGIAQDHRRGRLFYKNPRFKYLLKEGGATDSRTVTEARDATGDYRQMQDWERAFDGEYEVGEPYLYPHWTEVRTNLASGVGYEMFKFTVKDEQPNGLHAPSRSQYEVTVAFPSTGTTFFDTATNGLKAILPTVFNITFDNI